MLQQARNLLMHVADHYRLVQFLIHDRDAKFPRAFDALFDRDEIKVIRTPVRAANANAHMERWVGTVRRECLDRLSSWAAASSSMCCGCTSSTTTTEGLTAHST